MNKFIIGVLMLGTLYVTGCLYTEDEHITYECCQEEDVIEEFQCPQCIPRRYNIIFDGEYYTWEILGYMHWDMFDTVEEAIDNANRHDTTGDLERYERSWEKIPICNNPI